MLADLPEPSLESTFLDLLDLTDRYYHVLYNT